MSSEAIPNTAEASATGTTAARKATVQEYFELERASEVRHEYIDGEIVAMAGETPIHNVIAGNVYYRFRSAFEIRQCEVYIEGVRTRVSPTRYRYPDIVALCGEAKFDEDKPPLLLNPQVIVEVLSASTESTDRENKFDEYRQLETLTDYVLVAQDRVEVTHYARQSARQWLVTIYVEPNAALSFPSLEVSLTVADVYRKTALAAA